MLLIIEQVLQLRMQTVNDENFQISFEIFLFFSQDSAQEKNENQQVSSKSINSVPMIMNLIDSLVDHNDENLLSTIDHLINNLKHLRENIQTVRQDDSHPLNLTKPKLKSQQTCLLSTNADEKYSSVNSASSPSNFVRNSSVFPSQPFFPPFSGKIRSTNQHENVFLF